MREMIAELDKILPVVERVHGEHHPELHRVADLYADLKENVVIEDENAAVQDVNAVAEIFGQLREITSDFTAPEDACPTYRKVYADLAILEGKLA